MKCKNCGGLVLWDWPIHPNGPNETTCQSCGAKNSQIIESESDESPEVEDYLEQQFTCVGDFLENGEY